MEVVLDLGFKQHITNNYISYDKLDVKVVICEGTLEIVLWRNKTKPWTYSLSPATPTPLELLVESPLKDISVCKYSIHSYVYDFKVIIIIPSLFIYLFYFKLCVQCADCIRKWDMLQSLKKQREDMGTKWTLKPKRKQNK